jgi:hypothetical protein
LRNKTIETGTNVVVHWGQIRRYMPQSPDILIKIVTTTRLGVWIRIEQTWGEVGKRSDPSQCPKSTPL